MYINAFRFVRTIYMYAFSGDCWYIQLRRHFRYSRILLHCSLHVYTWQGEVPSGQIVNTQYGWSHCRWSIKAAPTYSGERDGHPGIIQSFSFPFTAWTANVINYHVIPRFPLRRRVKFHVALLKSSRRFAKWRHKNARKFPDLRYPRILLNTFIPNLGGVRLFVFNFRGPRAPLVPPPTGK